MSWVSYFINSGANYLIQWVVISDFIMLHLQVCELVKVYNQFAISPDPDDNFLFDLCKKVNVDYLITFDKLLLNFHHHLV